MQYATSAALTCTAAATGLLLALGFVERRRTFALAAALGARPRQLANLIWAEVALVGLLGLGFAAVLGTALSQLLVTILTGVFDPPPDRLAVPYLVGVTALGVACLVAAAAAAVTTARRPAMTVLRDL